MGQGNQPDGQSQPGLSTLRSLGKVLAARAAPSSELPSLAERIISGVGGLVIGMGYLLFLGLLSLRMIPTHAWNSPDFLIAWVGMSILVVGGSWLFRRNVRTTETAGEPAGGMAVELLTSAILYFPELALTLLKTALLPGMAPQESEQRMLAAAALLRFAAQGELFTEEHPPVREVQKLLPGTSDLDVQRGCAFLVRQGLLQTRQKMLSSGTVLQGLVLTTEGEALAHRFRLLPPPNSATRQE